MPLFPGGPDPVGSPTITGNNILHPFGQQTISQPIVEQRPHPQDVVKALHQRVKVFTETWLRYMPPHLIARSKWFHPRQNLQVGDMVLLLESGMKGSTVSALCGNARSSQVFNPERTAGCGRLPFELPPPDTTSGPSTRCA